VTDGRDDITWPHRVRKHKIKRLYESDAQGMLDTELVDDVGISLFVRCESILTIHEAKHNRVKCPRCARQGRTTTIQRLRPGRDPRDELLECPVCDWQLTWGEYALSYKRKQLNSGGAVSAFVRYVRRYRMARTPKEKLLAIDQLIHAFHYSLVRRPELPTRPASVNLIQGKLADVIQFLNELTYGTQSTVGLADNQQSWQDTMETYDEVLATWRRGEKL
jgi:endogenous inhibitor of DNA gyrase (YacG/DUF329 family)